MTTPEMIDVICAVEPQVAERMDSAIMNAQDRILSVDAISITSEQESEVLQQAYNEVAQWLQNGRTS